MGEQLQDSLATLKENEERYRTLVNNIPMGVFRTSTSDAGEFFTFNNALMEILGIEDPEIMKKVSSSQFYTNPNDREIIMNEIREKWNDQELGINVETAGWN